VLIVVISGVPAFAATAVLEPPVVARGFEGTATDIGGAADCVDDAVSLVVLLESFAAALLGTDLDGGNSSWETAIAMSERNRARKKRLSIQGTGS